jgi:hypothetical protein
MQRGRLRRIDRQGSVKLLDGFGCPPVLQQQLSEVIAKVRVPRCRTGEFFGFDEIPGEAVARLLVKKPPRQAVVISEAAIRSSPKCQLCDAGHIST